MPGCDGARAEAIRSAVLGARFCKPHLWLSASANATQAALAVPPWTPGSAAVTLPVPVWRAVAPQHDTEALKLQDDVMALRLMDRHELI